MLNDEEKKAQGLHHLPKEVTMLIFSHLDPKGGASTILAYLPTLSTKLKVGFAELTYEKYLALQKKQEKSEDEEILLRVIERVYDVLRYVFLNLSECFANGKDTYLYEKMLDEVLAKIPLKKELILNLYLDGDNNNPSGILTCSSQTMKQDLLATREFIDQTTTVREKMNALLASGNYNDEQLTIVQSHLQRAYTFLAENSLTDEGLNAFAKEVRSQYITFNEALEENLSLSRVKYVLITKEDSMREKFKEEVHSIMSNSKVFLAFNFPLDPTIGETRNIILDRIIEREKEMVTGIRVCPIPLHNDCSGQSVLINCNNLLEVDLSAFRLVRHISNGFLLGCKSLASINLSHLRNVNYIDEFFLTECTKLTSLDLSPLRYTSTIGDGFLSGCSNLTSLDLSPLKSLRAIKDFFLFKCKSLTSVNFSEMKMIEKVDERCFLKNCLSLKTIYIDNYTSPALREAIDNYKSSNPIVEIINLSTQPQKDEENKTDSNNKPKLR